MELANLLSLREAAAALDASIDTVRRRLGHDLPYYRVGGRIKIARHDLVHFLAANYVEAAKATKKASSKEATP